MNPEKEKLTSEHWHELAERSYIMANNVETLLVDHPAAVQSPEILQRLELAVELLHGVYKEAGAKM